mmetsp:Transcript_11129/g.68528  ORF Transcript_11129/g.68528 Transcript_11129/m.68528 type:complete len:371 (+) Transcript_11129:198-1310(+)
MASGTAALGDGNAGWNRKGRETRANWPAGVGRETLETVDGKTRGMDHQPHRCVRRPQARGGRRTGLRTREHRCCFRTRTRVSRCRTSRCSRRIPTRCKDRDTRLRHLPEERKAAARPLPPNGCAGACHRPPRCRVALLHIHMDHVRLPRGSSWHEEIAHHHGLGQTESHQRRCGARSALDEPTCYFCREKTNQLETRDDHRRTGTIVQWRVRGRGSRARRSPRCGSDERMGTVDGVRSHWPLVGSPLSKHTLRRCSKSIRGILPVGRHKLFGRKGYHTPLSNGGRTVDRWRTHGSFEGRNQQGGPTQRQVSRELLRAHILQVCRQPLLRGTGLSGRKQRSPARSISNHHRHEGDVSCRFPVAVHRGLLLV